MNVKEYFNLTEEEQKKICQKLSPYIEEEIEIFVEVKNKFIEKYNDPNIDQVKCGLYPGIGPYNSIKVFILKDKKRVKLPETFFGFPVIKFYESKLKQYNGIKKMKF